MLRLALVAGIVASASSVGAQPAAIGTEEANVETDVEPEKGSERRQARYFVDLQLGLGALTQDDLEFGISWSAGAGLRVLPWTFAFARLRHSSPFRDSLIEDLIIEWALESDNVDFNDGPPRTHQTELALGVGVRLQRWWLESSFGGVLIYQVSPTDYENTTRWLTSASIGYQLTTPSEKPDDVGINVSLGGSLDPFDGKLLKVIAGLGATVWFL